MQEFDQGGLKDRKLNEERCYAKPNDLSSIPGTHKIGENSFFSSLGFSFFTLFYIELYFPPLPSLLCPLLFYCLP